MAVAILLLKCCLYYHCRQVPTAEEAAEDLLEAPSDVKSSQDGAEGKDKAVLSFAVL